MSGRTSSGRRGGRRRRGEKPDENIEQNTEGNSESTTGEKNTSELNDNNVTTKSQGKVLCQGKVFRCPSYAVKCAYKSFLNHGNGIVSFDDTEVTELSDCASEVTEVNKWEFISTNESDYAVSEMDESIESVDLIDMMIDHKKE